MNKFRELFNKYINNKADEKEKQYIEDEIEKVEIINDYLAEQLDDEIMKNDILDEELFEEKDSNLEDQILKNIQKTIKKKLIKTGMYSVIVVILLLLSIKFIISPFVDSLYYNPMKSKIDNGDIKIEALDIDFSVFSELHFPGVTVDSSTITPLGMGEYDIEFYQYDYFMGNNNIYNAKLKRNKLTVQSDFYKHPYANVFTRGMAPFYEYPADKNDKEEINKLKELPEYINTKAYISFKEDLRIDEVMKVMKDNNIIGSWVGIRSCPKELQRYPYLGFAYNRSGIIRELNEEDNKNYPYIEIGTLKDEEATSKVLETHFRSLLKYMSDNKEFSKLGIIYEESDQFYKEALDYIDKEGIKSYGMVVTGTPKEILKLRENSMIENIYIDDLKLSK